MTAPEEQLRRVRSGDVDLLVRHFGQPERTPVIILHGANYHDSFDWRGIAESLAVDREVIAYDARGFGGSDWSPSKDYTLDANVGDVIAVMDHAGWREAVLVGHTRGAAFATVAAAYYSDRVAGMALMEWIPNTGIRHPGKPLLTTQSVNTIQRPFTTIEDALNSTTRSPDLISTSEGRARLESILRREGEYHVIAARDPDFQNPIPLTPGNWTTNLPVDIDLWRALDKAGCPTLYIEALHSNIGITHEDRGRLRRDYKWTRWDAIEARTDLPFEAPDAVVRSVKHFLADYIDADEGSSHA